MAKIKNLKKFKKYNMRVVNKSILLICNGKVPMKEIEEVNDKKLLTDVYNIGKNFNKIFNEYFKREKEKINSEVLHFDNVEKVIQNEKIINLFKDICSRDFKDGFTQIGKSDLNNENDFFVDIDKYVTFYNFFKNAYGLLKKNNVSLNELLTPDEVHDLILEEKYGITCSHNKTLTDLELTYIDLIRILEDNKTNIDYSSLVNNLNYIPLNIKHLYGEIIENNSLNTYSKKAFKEVEDFCNRYGLPYWKNNIYDNKEIEIPINNFILICLAIYIYTELWNKILSYDKFEEWEEYIYSFYVLNIDFDYDELKQNVIMKLIKNIESFDFYIMNNCNELLGHKLSVYRKKVLDKTTSTLGNETIYESLILATWDLFYLNYFGSNKLFKPIIYKICGDCNKEIRDKSHTIRDGSKVIICEQCYQKRKKSKNRERVKKYREKNLM